MNTAERDLLVISRHALKNEDAFEEEVNVLNEILQEVEILQNIACSSEIFDLNRFRIITKPDTIIKHLKEKKLPPFAFICNRN